MSHTLELVKALAVRGEVKVSDHGYDELAADGIFVRDIVSGLASAQLVEDYPRYPRGPCVLVLENDAHGKPVHAVWGIPRGETTPAVLVTAYRPDTDRWSSDFRSRRT